VIGLETAQEHVQVFTGLNDRQSEALLLLTLIPQAQNSSQLLDAWRRGDADLLAQQTRAAFNDYPSFGRRLLDDRNHNWIPKIEQYLNSGKIYFVVAGAAHMGGPEGGLALLRARGYGVEQL